MIGCIYAVTTRVIRLPIWREPNLPAHRTWLSCSTAQQTGNVCSSRFVPFSSAHHTHNHAAQWPVRLATCVRRHLRVLAVHPGYAGMIAASSTRSMQARFPFCRAIGFRTSQHLNFSVAPRGLPSAPFLGLLLREALYASYPRRCLRRARCFCCYVFPRLCPDVESNHPTVEQ